MPEARAPPRFVDTVLFVDVDGVLNVSVRDGVGRPLSLSSENLEIARNFVRDGVHNASGEKLVDVSKRQAGASEEDYAALASDASSGVSDVLVSRLVQLIKAAGKRCKVVLSSSWRLPKYAKSKANLETLISKHLGEKFTFDGATDLVPDFGAEGRLRTLGDAIAKLCSKSKRRFVAKHLRVLVLEDFFIAALGVWSCGGMVMDSVETIEEHLRHRAPPGIDLDVRVVHTYDSWTHDGEGVEVGSGLTRNHFSRAMDFLETSTSEKCHEQKRSLQYANQVGGCLPLHVFASLF